MGQEFVNRDRHGRGLRRPIPSKLFHHGFIRSIFFETVVVETCEYLRDSFPNELAALNFSIEDVPIVTDGQTVKRWSSNREQMRIILYRIPIQRLGGGRLVDPRMQIEQAVISAAADLIDKDPWELIHPH
jgi:hypothetical protein